MRLMNQEKKFSRIFLTNEFFFARIMKRRLDGQKSCIDFMSCIFGIGIKERILESKRGKTKWTDFTARD